MKIRKFFSFLEDLLDKILGYMIAIMFEFSLLSKDVGIVILSGTALTIFTGISIHKMKKIVILLCFCTCIIGFSDKRQMIDFMRSHNRNLSFEESSFIYDVTMHYANMYKVDPVLVFSVMKTESHFRHSTVSSAGALGLMQLMPFNFKEFGVNNSIEGNIKGGIMHLKRDLEKTGNIVKTLVCYNAGCSRLKNNKWLSIKETTDYVSKINRIYPIIKKILFDNSKGAYSQKNQNMGNSESEKENEESIAEDNKKVRRLKIERNQ